MCLDSDLIVSGQIDTVTLNCVSMMHIYLTICMPYEIFMCFANKVYANLHPRPRTFWLGDEKSLLKTFNQTDEAITCTAPVYIDMKLF